MLFAALHRSLGLHFLTDFIVCVKVQLQHKIKQESEQFRQWKASREKEVLQVILF